MYEKPDVSIGAAAGLRFGPDVRGEVHYRQLRLPPETGPGIVDQQSLRLSAYADFWTSHWLTAFGGIGIGASLVDFNDQGETVPFATAALGYSIALTAGGALRLENEVAARYSYDEKELLGREELVDGEFALRLRYQFGSFDRVAETPQLAIPGPQPSHVACDGGGPYCASAPKSLDGDGDGVPDRDDRCPSTIPNVRVDTDGCMTVR